MALKISIDPNRCQGHGRCFSLAPTLFDSDDLGNGFVIGTGAVPEGCADLARRCEANCPEHAITIEE